MYVYIFYVYNNILGIQYENDNGNTQAPLPPRAKDSVTRGGEMIVKRM